jgi:hypothetical protein
MATSPKGFTQIDASNPPNGPAQINGAELFVENLIGEHVATSSDLPSSGNWVGRHIWVDDDGFDYVCTALPSAWVALSPATLAAFAVNPNMILSTTNTALTGFSKTVNNMRAVPVIIRATVQLNNSGSGADRDATLRIYEDDTAIGTARRFAVPWLSPGSISMAVLTVPHTPTAGSHTYKVFGYASINSAVSVFDSDLTISLVI